MKKIKKMLFPAVTFALTLVAALFWTALRINYSGISKFLGADTNQGFLIMNLPVMVCVLAWVGFALALLGLLMWNGRKWPSVTALVIGIVVSLGAAAVVYFGAKDYLRFISGHFWRSVGVSACILSFALVLFFPVQNTKKTLAFKGILVCLVLLTAVIVGYGLRPCEFTYGAVVYAVEDEYQIVFSTSDNAVAWVEIGGARYDDLYAGSMRSADRVHKVCLPQEALDAAGGYTVCAKQMIYRGPFGGYTGETISRHYRFRPVDTSDGLRYDTISDIHESVDAAVRAAGTDGELDFLVMLGDNVSMVETEEDAQLANVLAYGVTGGEIPVIYARGNHEIKGEYAEKLYQYVGSNHGDFYYTVTLGEDVFAVVLDLGEDHEDDWWEYYGTARFDQYRAEQTRMLEEVLSDGDYEAYRYRMVLCHIPIPYVEDGDLFDSFRLEWTELLNELNPDICLSGHLHKLWPLIPGAVEPGTELTYTLDYVGKPGKSPGGYLTDFRFPTFIVGRRSLEQTGSTRKNQYTCLSARVDFEAGCQWCRYVNSEGNVLTGSYPLEGDYPSASFRDIRTELKRP